MLFNPLNLNIEYCTAHANCVNREILHAQPILKTVPGLRTPSRLHAEIYWIPQMNQPVDLPLCLELYPNPLTCQYLCPSPAARKFVVQRPTGVHDADENLLTLMGPCRQKNSFLEFPEFGMSCTPVALMSLRCTYNFHAPPLVTPSG